MKKPISLLAFLFICNLSAMDSEITLDNDHVRTSKVKLEAHEEIDHQHNEYPQLILSFKGGILTRIETNGTKTEIKLPKNIPVYQDQDPAGEYHKFINNTCKPLEIIVIELKTKPSAS